MGTAFVTGATGFVGSHLTRQLIENGQQVRILRRENSKVDAIQDLPLEHVIGSLFDTDLLVEHLRGVDVVFHVAAVASYWRSDTKSIYRVNVDGTRNLLQAAECAGIGRFIFTSSVAAIVHTRNHFPASENTHFNIDPRISPYGHSKFLAEAEVMQAVQRGLDAVTVNPAIIIGPG
ncbi:MAG TPA: NAD-dependent epimerase/dehydratase family protein, partial [Aggregatilineales bacterium]|nr:NAD-dependent epimerase/dehydratase family protein [Aggregatilineales bacterium]